MSNAMYNYIIGLQAAVKNLKAAESRIMAGNCDAIAGQLVTATIERLEKHIKTMQEQYRNNYW